MVRRARGGPQERRLVVRVDAAGVTYCDGSASRFLLDLLREGTVRRARHDYQSGASFAELLGQFDQAGLGDEALRPRCRCRASSGWAAPRCSSRVI